MFDFLFDLLNDTVEFVAPPAKGPTLFNVHCIYGENRMTEIFQIVAWDKEDALQRANSMAWLKGYKFSHNPCEFVI